MTDMNLTTNLKAQIRSGAIDTVMVALPDPFGRLVGKRFRGDFFLKSVAQARHARLQLPADGEPRDGSARRLQGGQLGYRLWRFRLASRIRIRSGSCRGSQERPWFCDHVRQDGTLVAEAPRSVLRRQLSALQSQGLTCFCASELEFYLFNQTYHAAFAGGYRDLQPSSDYRIDYHLMQPTRDEPLMRAIRNGMTAARVPVESSKGEWSRGQHEINFIYAAAACRWPTCMSFSSRHQGNCRTARQGRVLHGQIRPDRSGQFATSTSASGRAGAICSGNRHRHPGARPRKVSTVRPLRSPSMLPPSSASFSGA